MTYFMKTIPYILLFILALSTSCSDEYLDVLPEDKITTANFPQNEADVKLALNGVYTLLQERSIYNEGLFGFGVLDGATPNGFNWGNTAIAKVGNGQLSAQDEQMITYRWTRCYAIIFRANYLLNALEEVTLKDNVKAAFKGEAHFLRGLAYATLVESYGGVPIIKGAITAEEARNIARASAEETWNQAISDYDVAIQNLAKDAPELGRATKGAALGMKMRAYLYQNKYDKVLEMVEQIDAPEKVRAFPQLCGLVQAREREQRRGTFRHPVHLG